MNLSHHLTYIKIWPLCFCHDDYFQWNWCFSKFFEMKLFPSGHFELSTCHSLGSPWEESEVAPCACLSDAGLFGFNSVERSNLEVDSTIPWVWTLICVWVEKLSPVGRQAFISLRCLRVWWDKLLQVPAALISAIIDFTSELYGKINPWFWVYVGGGMAGGKGQVRVSYHSHGLKEGQLLWLGVSCLLCKWFLPWS